MDAKLQNVQTNDMFEKMVLMLQSIVDEGSLNDVLCLKALKMITNNFFQLPFVDNNNNHLYTKMFFSKFPPYQHLDLLNMHAHCDKML